MLYTQIGDAFLIPRVETFTKSISELENANYDDLNGNDDINNNGDDNESKSNSSNFDVWKNNNENTYGGKKSRPDIPEEIV